jgi:hypothetical protein
VRGVDWRGVAVVLLVVGVFTVLIIGAIGATLNPERTVSTEEIATVAAVLGSAIGAIAVYLGTKANGKPPAAREQLPDVLPASERAAPAHGDADDERG